MVGESVERRLQIVEQRHHEVDQELLFRLEVLAKIRLAHTRNQDDIGNLGVRLTVAGYTGGLVLCRSLSYGVWPSRAPWGRSKL